MNIQDILVSICLFLALIFMGKKILNTLKRRGGCDCDGCKNKTRACAGGGSCPGQIVELKPGGNKLPPH